MFYVFLLKDRFLGTLIETRYQKHWLNAGLRYDCSFAIVFFFFFFLFD